MGMLATWIFQLTTPLRDLKFRINAFRFSLMAKIFGYQKIQKGLVGDVRQLARKAGVSPSQGQKPKPSAPQKAPPKAQQRPSPRKR